MGVGVGKYSWIEYTCRLFISSYESLSCFLPHKRVPYPFGVHVARVLHTLSGLQDLSTGPQASSVVLPRQKRHGAKMGDIHNSQSLNRYIIPILIMDIIPMHQYAYKNVCNSILKRSQRFHLLQSSAAKTYATATTDKTFYIFQEDVNSIWWHSSLRPFSVEVGSVPHSKKTIIIIQKLRLCHI